MSLTHEGRFAHRLKSHPAERVFAAEWRKINTRRPGTPHGMLDHLLSEDCNRPITDPLDQATATAIATVMQ